jgi:hypothetical protein
MHFSEGRNSTPCDTPHIALSNRNIGFVRQYTTAHSLKRTKVLEQMELEVLQRLLPQGCLSHFPQFRQILSVLGVQNMVHM